MKLASFEGGFGRVDDGLLLPMGPDLVSFLEGRPAEEGEAIPFTSVRLRAPVPRPGKVIGVGLNYRTHAEETNQPVPSEPVLFGKYANSVIGDGEPVLIPQGVGGVDYEAELGVVIGRRTHRVGVAEGLSCVVGYLCTNDVSARDLQFLPGGQWMRGKAVDTFLPTGPWLVTADEVGDPQALGIRCLLNGDVMQSSNTADMIFPVGELVSFISRTITLDAGDVISTGTPSGVGFQRKPPRFLQEGDEMVVEIERIGRLANPVRHEAAPR